MSKSRNCCRYNTLNKTPIDQFRYIKIQSNTKDLSTRIWGINHTNSVFAPQSLALRSIVLSWILIYRNWSINRLPFSHPNSEVLTLSSGLPCGLAIFRKRRWQIRISWLIKTLKRTLIMIILTWFFLLLLIKAMLHEAIFLATCNATMTNKKPFKLQRGCHTFATFFATCNAYNNKQIGGRAKRTKDELWLAHSDKIALQVAEGMLHASNLSRNVAKSRGSFYFSCNSQRNNCSCKMGCYTWIFSCNLQRNVCCVASCKKNCFA